MKKERSIWPSTELLLPWVVGLGIVLLMAAVLGDLVEDVWFKEGFAWDAPIILAIHGLSRPWLDSIMRGITWTGETGAMLAAAGLALWFAWKRRWVDAAAVLAVVGGAVALNTLMKLIFARPRPALFPPLVTESGFSFPSGHVTAATAVYGFLAILLWENRHGILALLCAFWVLLVAVSRIYLGVHYPSDTLAAIIFTSLILLVVFLVRDRYLARRRRKAGE